MLINRNYRRLFAGQAISVIGDEVFDTTLLLWVGIVLLAGRPYAPLVSSAVLVLTSVVIVLLGPVAGVFVDRWNKRRILLRADAIRGRPHWTAGAGGCVSLRPAAAAAGDPEALANPVRVLEVRFCASLDRLVQGCCRL